MRLYFIIIPSYFYARSSYFNKLFNCFLHETFRSGVRRFYGLFVRAKIIPWKLSFQQAKKMEIAWYQVKTLQWVVQLLETEILKAVDSFVGRMRLSVILKQNHTFWKFTTFLNSIFTFSVRSSFNYSIHRFSFRWEANKNGTFHISDQLSYHQLSCSNVFWIFWFGDEGCFQMENYFQWTDDARLWFIAEQLLVWDKWLGGK